MRFNVQVKGLASLQKQIETASEKVKEVCMQEVQAAGQDWVAGAVRDAPVDQGALKGSISFKQSDTHTAAGSLISVEIVAQKFYAPFVEFGTKGKYKPIPGTEEIAAKFKGYKGGDLNEMIRMIARWMRKKGGGHRKTPRFGKQGKYNKKSEADQFQDDFKLAWPLVLYILINGINPHPYFFKQGDTVWPNMVQRMQKALQRETKVSVIAPGDIRRPNIITI